MVLPDQTGTNPHLLVAGGKEGKVYLINRDNMGKYQQCGATCDAVLSAFMLYPSGGFTGAIFSVPAYFNGFVYYQGVNQVLKAFSLTNGTLSSSPASQSSTSFGFPGATPSISANGTSNGIVWTIQVDGYYNGTPAVLHAYDALNLSSELYNSNKIAADQLASGVKFNTPTIANGKVYVATQTQLSVFGLAPLGAPSSLTATAVNSSQINLAWSQATGAVGYQIEKCQGANCTSFTQIGTSTSTTFSNTGLTASTSYSYRVRATDSAGNLSAYSNTATATTPGQDTHATDGTVRVDGHVVDSSQINLVMDCLHGQCRSHRLPGGAMLRGRMHRVRPDRHLHEHDLFRHGPDGQHQLQLSREGNGRGRQPQRLFQHRHCDHDGHDGRHHQVHPGQLPGPPIPATSVAVTYTAAQSAGDLNVVVVGWNDATTTVSSVTDTSDNTYTLAVGPTVRPGPAAAASARPSTTPRTSPARPRTAIPSP